MNKEIIDMRNKLLSISNKNNNEFNKENYINTIKSNDFDLTIIVPCYNTGKYVAECIDSIINQKTKYSFEIVAVNDGSIDDTKQVLDRYKDKIRIIHKLQNEGVSKARNEALKFSLGKYVMFVDSDDLLPKGAIEKLINASDNFKYDLVEGAMCNFKKIFGIQIEKIQKKKQGIFNNFKEAKLQGYPFMKIIKREKFENVLFPDFWYEDTILTYWIFSKCNRIKVISDLVYQRRLSETSIFRNADCTEIKRIDNYWIMEEIFNYINEYKSINKALLYEQTVKSQMSRLYKHRNLCMHYEIRFTIFTLFSEMLIKEYPKPIECKDKDIIVLDELIRNKKFEEFEKKIKEIF